MSSIQCDFKGAIRGTSKEKLYQELGFESFKDRRQLRQLSYLYKLVSTKQLAYHYDLIYHFEISTRNKGCIYEPFYRTMSFDNFRFENWDELDPEIRNVETCTSF